MKRVVTLFAVLMISTLGLIAQTTYTLGTGTLVNGTSGWPTAYGQYYTGHKVQYLILASELSGLGIAPGNMLSLAFDVVTPTPPTASGTAPDGSNLKNFTIKMGSTTATAISGFLPVTTTVYTVPQFITTVGWNVHTFTTPFFWDGISNLVIETCYDNYITASNYSSNAVVNQTATSFNSYVQYYSDAGGTCASTTISGTPYAQRPNMQLSFAAGSANDAGVTAITSPVAPVAPGTHNVVATVTNFGSAALTSATIGWSVNGVLQTPVNWTGNLATAQSATGVAIGSFVFPAGPSTIKVWTSSPNGQTDGFNGNDTSTVTINFSAPLSGTYTIGGAGADYPNIAAALASMSSAGISGPVIFNVTPNSGPYIGGYTFGTYPGISATNTVTFNGNANVINEGTSTFFMDFNGASYITLNNFQLINTVPATAKFGIIVRGGSQFLSFTNNYIDMGTVATGTGQACIALTNSTTSATSTGNNGQNITITNNELVGGYYGISMYGQSSYLNNFGHVVSNNIVRDFYLYGIRLDNIENSIVSGNNINRALRGGVGSFYGVYTTTGRNLKVIGNQIHSGGAGSYTAYPIYLSTSVNVMGSETEFINNAVYNVPTSGTLYGFYFLGTRDYVNVYHNTVHLDVQLAGTKYAFYASTAPNNHTLKNNIFSVQGPGTGSKYCIYISSTSTSFVSDYNDFYMGGTGGTVNNVGYWTAARNTLADWQLATSQDANSFSVNPDFFAVNDFRTNSIALYQMGTPIPGISTDIFGTPRNANNPCLGAFEYTLYLRDAGIVAMTEPVAVCPGLAPVKVKIKNWGIQPFTGATIHWSVNGIAQAPFSYTNTLAIGAEEEVTLGSYTFAGGVTYNFVFHSENPGGQADQNPANDTLMVNGFMTALNGTYTIGPALTDDFSTLQAAVDALVSRGICGPVVFNVATGSGPYDGGVQIPAINGSSALNTITFNGNGAVVNATAQPYILGFFGTSYVTVNNFQFINPVPANSRFGIHVSGGSQYLSFTNNVIDVGTTSTSTTSGGIIVSGSPTSATTAGNNGSYLTITGNHFIGGYYGITMLGNASYLDCMDHVITDNFFDNYYFYGVYLSNVDGAVVSDNEFTRDTRTSLSTFYGLYMSTARNVKFRNNVVHSSGAASYSCYPVYITTSVNLPGAETEIVNNLFYDFPTTSTFYGLYMLGTRENINIYHNTMHVETNAANTVRPVFFSTAPTTHTMRNNIFSITGSGTGAKHMIYASATSTSFYSDNNVLYLGTTAGTNYVGYTGTNQATLADWQLATNQDLGSVESNPVFAAPSMGNLMPLSSAVDNIGFPVGVVEDIYGNPRSPVNPDPGAIEFIGIAADIALNSAKMMNSLCLSNSDTVQVTVTNTIGTTIDFSVNPLTATWMVTGPVNSNGTIVVNTGTLAPATSMTVTGLGVNFSQPGDYTLSAYIGASSTNLFTGNDTLMETFMVEIKDPFEVEPAYTVITNTTDTLVLKAKSPFFPAGAFFMTEICHYKTTTGGPAAGWTTAYPWLIADDYIEITGVPGSDLAGYTLEQWSATALVSSHTFSTGKVMSPSGTATIAVGQMGSSVESPSNYYYHGNGSFTSLFSSTEAAGRILKDPAGNIVDAVGYGTYTFPAAANVTANDWSGNTPAVSGSGNRLVGPYTKTSANWIQAVTASPQDPGTVNNLVTVPAPQNLTGFAWSFQGFVIDTTSTEITVGPFTASGIYDFVASFTTPCGVYADTARIVVQLVEVFGDTTICAGGSAQIGAFLPGLPPFTIVVSDGSGQDTLAGIPFNTFAFPVSPTTTTTYTLVSWWDANNIPIPGNQSVTVTVIPLPVVALATPAPVCISALPVTLSGGTPVGGTYSGTGVTNGVFDPSVAGAGTHVITYTFTSLLGCTNTATANMVVNALPVINITPLPAVCINAAAFNLTGATPTGGTWSGPGVSGGMFNPSVAGAGSHTLTYTYTDVNSCTNSATTTILVNALPTVTLALADTVCINYAPITLSGGTPAGGTYSGNGVTAGVFNPATAGLGAHTITYTYTNPGTGCSASATGLIFVDACTGIDPVSGSLVMDIFPNPAKNEMNIDVRGITAPVEIRIMNLAGQEMFTSRIDGHNAQVRQAVDVSAFPAGLYYVRMESGSMSKVMKVVVLE